MGFGSMHIKNTKGMRTFLENEVYPVAAAAITLGAFELIAIVVTMAIIFTEKNMKEEFYENPFHG